MKKHPSYNNVLIIDYPISIQKGKVVETNVIPSTLNDLVEANPNKLIFVYRDLDGVIEHIDTGGARDYFCYIRAAVKDDDWFGEQMDGCFIEALKESMVDYSYLLIGG